MSHWLVILGVALVTFGLRASFIVFADPQRFPRIFRQALAFVPPAVLAAIVAPGILLNQGRVDVSADNLRWLAGLAAIAVAAVTRSVMASIVGGIGVLWFLQWAMG